MRISVLDIEMQIKANKVGSLIEIPVLFETEIGVSR